MIVLARALLNATGNRLDESAFSEFVTAVEEIEPLRLAELGGCSKLSEIALLEKISESGPKALAAFQSEGQLATSFGIGNMITSLRFIGERDWRSILEPLSVTHRTLLDDPAGIYGRMDFESREQYCLRVAKIAVRSDVDEGGVARLAVYLAKEAYVEPGAPAAVRDRLRHVGYYLLDSTGSQSLLKRAAYRPSFNSSIQRLFRQYPDEVYILGIEIVALIHRCGADHEHRPHARRIRSHRRSAVATAPGCTSSRRACQLSRYSRFDTASARQTGLFTFGRSRMRNDGRDSHSAHQR